MRRWPVVVGANLGIAVGVAATPAIAIGVSMRGLQHDFGWTRAQISLGPTIVMLVLAFGSPLVGWICDRTRVAWISASGLLALSGSFVFLAHLGPDIRVFYLACALTGLLASGAGTVPYARAVTASFHRRRGLALGLAMVGTGITAILAPMLLAPYVARVGWRYGYDALAVLAALAAPVVFVCLLPAPRVVPSPPAATAGREDAFKSALKGWTFWSLGLAFLAIPLAVGGLGLHMISYLMDAGVLASQAGRIAGLTGVVQIASRLTSGWLVDRFFAPRVGAVLMGAAAAALAAFCIFGASVAFLGAIAIGLALGAEIDLVGYLTARYFPLQAYGRIYGVLYSMSLVGSALSLVLYGWAFDWTHAYAPALIAGDVLLVLTVFAFLRLPRFAPATL